MMASPRFATSTLVTGHITRGLIYPLAWIPFGRENCRLLRLEYIIPYQIGNEPYDRDYDKQYKARTVVDYLGKGELDRY
jgi:hypothetical protein